MDKSCVITNVSSHFYSNYSSYLINKTFCTKKKSLNARKFLDLLDNMLQDLAKSSNIYPSFKIKIE